MKNLPTFTKEFRNRTLVLLVIFAAFLLLYTLYTDMKQAPIDLQLRNVTTTATYTVLPSLAASGPMFQVNHLPFQEMGNTLLFFFLTALATAACVMKMLKKYKMEAKE